MTSSPPLPVPIPRSSSTISPTGPELAPGERDRDLALADRALHPREPVVPVDQELLGVVRPPERLAVQAQVQLPVVALAQDRRRDLRQVGVLVALALLGPEDHVGCGGADAGGRLSLTTRTPRASSRM